MTTFEIGDIVVSDGARFIGIVIEETVNGSEARQSWRVFWNDGDTTHYEDGESMSHHQIKPEQWTNRLIKKYMDIICP